jgi:hypothetical protein
MTRLGRRPALFAALALTLAAAGACEDPFNLEATSETDPLTIEVWAVNGSPDEYPSALVLPPPSTLVRPDANGNFDIAFDVDVDGKLLLIPMRLVVTPLLGARDVKFIESPATFDQVVAAPIDGWENDSTIALDPGDVVIVRVFANQCQLQLRQYIYAKLVVDSIIPAERRARLRGRLNPNCGFRSFLEGIPEF